MALANKGANGSTDRLPLTPSIAIAMKTLILLPCFRLISLIAIPLSLQCCAQRPQSTAYGENVSYYFSSSFACPEHIPEWRQLGEHGRRFTSAARPDPGDASDAFGKALSTLDQRARELTGR